MEAKLYGQNKGGMSINGIIKDYYAFARENISAGDLVEYVNGVAKKEDYGESVDTQLSTQIASAYEAKAIQLDENRVFIAHQYNNSTQNVAGIVCTISGANITYGTDTQLNDIGNNKCYLPSKLLLLENGNVFIPYTTSSGYRVHGMLVSIDGSVITVEADTNLNNMAGSSSLSAELLPNGNIFIAHAYNTNYHLYGMIVNVNGTTITAGTDTAISTTQNSGEVISTELLANGNVFIAHSNAYYKTLTAMVVSISGTTITAGTNVQLSSVNYSGLVISTCLLKNGNVFVAHKYDDTNHYLYGVVCSINGTTVTKGTDTAISTAKYSGYSISVEPLPNNKAFILHSSSLTSTYTLYGIIINTDGIAITLGQDTPMNVTQSSGYSLSSLLLKNDTLFVIHGQTQSQYMLYAQIWGIDYDNNIPTNNISTTEYETQVRKVTTGQFDGIAKTSGEGGDETGHKDIVSIWTKEG